MISLSLSSCVSHIRNPNFGWERRAVSSMPGSATRLLNARPRSGGISCDGGFGWSGTAGLNGLAANAASSVSWPKDSDHRRLSSENGAVESSSGGGGGGGGGDGGLSSAVVSSRSSSSSCSAASFNCRVQESKSRGRRRRISNLAWYSQQQQLGYSCGIIKRRGYHQGGADCLLMTITSLSSSSPSSSSLTSLQATSTIQLAGTRNPSALLCGGVASRSCCGALGLQGSGLLSLPLGLKRVQQQQQQKRRNTHTNHSPLAPVRALGTSGQDRSDDMKKMGEAGEMQEALEVKNSTKHDPSQRIAITVFTINSSC